MLWRDEKKINRLFSFVEDKVLWMSIWIWFIGNQKQSFRCWSYFEDIKWPILFVFSHQLVLLNICEILCKIYLSSIIVCTTCRYFHGRRFKVKVRVDLGWGLILHLQLWSTTWWMHTEMGCPFCALENGSLSECYTSMMFCCVRIGVVKWRWKYPYRLLDSPHRINHC